MKPKELKSGFEDLKVLVKMADEVEGAKAVGEQEIQEKERRLNYIRSRMQRIVLNNHKRIRQALTKL